MPTEKFKNNASSTLNGAIDNITTTLTVVSATGFPTTGNFRIIIDGEIFTVINVAGNTFTTTGRPSEGTVAAPHANGAAVTHVLTAAALYLLLSETIQQGPLATLPAAERAGRIFQSTDSPLTFLDDGFAWVPYFRGKKVVLPTGFAWVNQGTATLSTANGGEFIRQAGGGAGDNIRARMVAVPATPYTRTACLIPMIPPGPSSYPMGGMALYDGTKFQTFGVQWRQDAGGVDNVRGFFIGITRWTNATTFSADAFGKPASYGAPIWLRISDDGTTRSFALSQDGFEFTTLFADTHTTFLTATQIGCYVDAVACPNDVGLRVLGWE